METPRSAAEAGLCPPGGAPAPASTQTQRRGPRGEPRVPPCRLSASRFGMSFLKRECILAARVRDRVNRSLRARERRDARDAGDERGFADQVAVAACTGALRRVDDEVAASAADEVDDRGGVAVLGDL